EARRPDGPRRGAERREDQRRQPGSGGVPGPRPVRHHPNRQPPSVVRLRSALLPRGAARAIGGGDRLRDVAPPLPAPAARGWRGPPPAELRPPWTARAPGRARELSGTIGPPRRLTLRESRG